MELIDILNVINNNFRKVIATGKHLQFVSMKLNPKENIGMEVHDTDQFIRIEKGYALVIVNNEKHKLRMNECILVYAGSEHDVVNLSKTRNLFLTTIYSEPEHTVDCVQKKKSDFEC